MPTPLCYLPFVFAPYNARQPAEAPGQSHMALAVEGEGLLRAARLDSKHGIQR